MAELNLGWLFLFMISGIILFVFFGNVLAKLLKNSWIIVLKITLGFIMLFFFNIFGQLIQFHIPLNIITAIVVGLLGIPGLFTLIIIKLFIIP